ncbi:MAG: tRNA/rRNA methyltransferase [Bacteroidales bacterium]
MNLYFILIEPAVPENIGAAARAIKTMGFRSLWIVNSKQYQEEKAKYLAHGANEILENARYFSTFKEMLSELDFSIATTSKSRSVRFEYLEGKKLHPFLSQKTNIVNHTGIIFGREKYGLSNEELKQCDIISSIPQINNYPSLNLGQAVMLYAYLLSDLSNQMTTTKKITKEKQSIGEYKTLRDKVEYILPKLGFDQETNIYGRITESLARVSQDDMHLFLSLINKISEKIEKP